MKVLYSLSFFLLLGFSCWAQSKALVLQTDFGLKDAAVSAMKGVAYGVSHDLAIFDNTHEIPAFNIWEAAYRLDQSARYWPAGTVFVSVVDPGVGSQRKSIVMKSKTGHYFVTPDNGTITLVADHLGVEEIRVIDESRNRLKNSYDSYTFHGRDVYAFTGARLASGIISFEDVGAVLREPHVKLEYRPAVFEKEGKVTGSIDILDVQYGNVWTNIPQEMITKLPLAYGKHALVKILFRGKTIYNGRVLFGKTFSDVKAGEVVAYMNSLLQFSLGINQGNFAEKFKVESGPGWTIEIAPAP